MSEFQRRLDEQQRQIEILSRGRQLESSGQSSSMAESEVPAAHNAQMIEGGPGYPVDEIKEQTPCDLYQEFKNITLKVAVGFALPILGSDGKPTLWYGHEIPPGYARVGVDKVEKDFESLRLEIPGPEGQDILGDVKGDIILWEKKQIKILGSTPPPGPRRSPSPPPGPRSSPSPPPSPRRSPSPPHDYDRHSPASPSRSPPPSQPSSPPPAPAKTPRAPKRKRANKSPIRKLPPLPKVPNVPPPRACDLTEEEP